MIGFINRGVKNKLGDVLSQNEIDSLLQALNTGELSMQEIESATDEKKSGNMILEGQLNFLKNI